MLQAISVLHATVSITDNANTSLCSRRFNWLLFIRLLVEAKVLFLMAHGFTGLARVTCNASGYPDKFRNYTADDIRDVSDLPVGEFVLVLPAVPMDRGWAAVIVNEDMPRGGQHARFTWVHPACLQPLHTRREFVIKVGHTLPRGDRRASCDIGLGPGPGQCVGDKFQI